MRMRTMSHPTPEGPESYPTPYDLALELGNELERTPSGYGLEWNHADDALEGITLNMIGITLLEKHIEKAIEQGREMERKNPAKV